MLEGYTALDLTGLEGQLAGKLLAELGMRVLKAEPPEGDPVRRLGPFAGGGAGPEGSLRFAFLNGGKESVVVEGPEEVMGLAGQVDVVLESGAPGSFPVEQLRAASPGLVVVSVTGFGQTGPHAGYRAPDIVGLAMGGLMYISGDRARPPVCAPETQAFYYGSVAAALGVVLALRRRELTGRGDHVDVSIQEAVATQEHLIREASLGHPVRREGSQHKHVSPARIFPCLDGHVFLFVSSIHWQRFLDLWDDHPREFDSGDWSSAPFRRANAARINGEVERFTRRYAKLELTERLQEAGIPCLPVSRPSEFMRDPQVVERDFFAVLRHERLGRYLCPRLPVTVDGRRLPAGPPPVLGANRGEPGPLAEPAAPGTAGPPLEGVRVLSLTTGIAGPNAARYLANFGAEVIKIESREGGLDAFRFFGSDLDASPRFLETNLGVSSVTLNLKEPAGVSLFKELVAESDVVLENFRPDVLPRLGLGYEALRTVREDIILARMPGLGATGPRRLYGTWGPTLAAFSGLTYLWNHPDQAEPVGSQGVLPDYLAGVLVPLIVTAALLRRARTGKGAELDLAQVEAAAYILGTSYLVASVNGSDPGPAGNADPSRALHGCYPCRGDDRWCVIVCEDESDWAAFCAESGCSPGASDRDLEVARWSAGRDAFEVMERLQAAGIAAGVVQSGLDLANDPHLAAREFVKTVSHPTLGTLTVAGLPLRFAEAPTRPYRCASPLAGDNEAVVCGLLGYGREQLAAWEKAHVVY